MGILASLVILLAVVFAAVVYLTEQSQADKRTHDRLAAIHHRVTELPEEGILLHEVGFSQIALVDRLLRNNRLAADLRLKIEQAKLSWTVGRFFLYSAAFIVLGGAISSYWIPVGFVGWLPGMLLGFAPLGWVLYKRSVRMRRLTVMLPQAVDLMARGMRAGFSLSSSMVMVADEVSDPLGPEFRRTADEMNFGLPFQEAMSNLAHRFPVPEMRFLVTAILVQKETGGNLVELLEKIAKVLRARVQLAQKVRVYTAQGRMTGVILVALPFVLFVLLNLVSPGYSKPMFESEAGRRIVYAALIAMAVGIAMIRRIVDVRV